MSAPSAPATDASPAVTRSASDWILEAAPFGLAAADPPLAATVGVSLGLPAAGATLFLRAFRRLRATKSGCPVCGSRHGAEVGQVGAYRHNRRCHSCGFLWDS